MEKDNTVNVFKVINSEDALKFKLMNGIDDILKRRFEPLGRWMKKTNKKGEDSWGVGNFSPSGELVWADINRFNTNYSGHNYMQTTLNNLCKQHNKNEYLNFESAINDYWRTMSEIKKMVRLMDEFQDIIFDENGEIFKTLILIMDKSWENGLKYTKDFNENFKTYFPTAIGIISEDDEKGNYDDMVKGIDTYLLFKPEIKKSIQIKGARCHLIGENYIVYVSMDIKKYEFVWAFVFYDELHKQIYIFKIDISKIEQIISNDEPAFLFPIELFKGKFDYAGNN